MDESSTTQNRRSRRSKLLMAASLEHAGGMTPVTLRNLSAEGALVEGDHDLAPGVSVIFRRQELAVSGKIAWAAGRRAGIAFDMELDPETVLRHIPPPRYRMEPAFKRPGLSSPELSPEERRFAEIWVASSPFPSIGE